MTQTILRQATLTHSSQTRAAQIDAAVRKPAETASALYLLAAIAAFLFMAAVVLKLI